MMLSNNIVIVQSIDDKNQKEAFECAENDEALISAINHFEENQMTEEDGIVIAKYLNCLHTTNGFYFAKYEKKLFDLDQLN